jgi:S1-C subfamily serine protease
VPIGDSDTIQIGDTLSVLGFPGLGGETVTLTRGTVSGFHGEAGLTRAWVKTDTEINRGNSGGMALNDAGELIGIPTFVGTDVYVTGKLGYIRPVNLARSLIELARQ